MNRFSCVLIGDGSLTRGCGDQLLQAGHEIRAVVTQDADVRDWATGRGLAALGSPDMLHRIAGSVGFDWLLSVANLRLLSNEIVGLARLGAVNFHDGPLPAYAGLNTPVWAILNGETEHGITWHMMDAGVDTGDVLVTRRFAIGPDETAHSLNTKAYAAGLESFGEMMAALETGQPEIRPQGGGRRILCKAADRPPAAGMLNVAASAEHVLRLVRALNFEGYFNPLCAAKVQLGEKIALVSRASRVEGAGAAGQVLEVGCEEMSLAFADGAVRLEGLRDRSGRSVDVRNWVQVGHVVRPLGDARATDIGVRMSEHLPYEGYWRDRLAAMDPIRFPLARTDGRPLSWRRVEIAGARGLDRDSLRAVCGLCALQSAGQEAGDIAWASGRVSGSIGGLLSPWVPVRVSRKDLDWPAMRQALQEALYDVAEHGAFATDLIARDPSLAGCGTPDIALAAVDQPVPESAMTLWIGNGTLILHADETRLDPDSVALVVGRLEAICERVHRDETDLGRLSELPGAERRDVTERWTDTASDYDAGTTVHGAIEAMVVQQGETTALVFEDREVSYRQMNARANAVAGHLRAAGVARGDLVALAVPRGPDMVIGALAILKVGGAYVPVDPSYPSERIAYCIDDSAAKVLVTRSDVTALGETGACRIDIDGIAETDCGPVDGGAGPDDLAYVIYTSGSTGRPKGVMIEHRNIANFRHAMDAHVDMKAGKVWMAVTSLAFDISVLELFYALARGFKVVISGDETRGAISDGAVRAGSIRPMDFSIYYWGADDVAGPGKYDLLLEGARYADENGFAAIWTPERHFHAFGGPYPNPSVTGASVAGFTKNIGVRAGSIVAPLHHPARIAEEWAVIDNLTAGRAGLAFASGWQPDDFVLRPENTPPANRAALFDTLQKARALWRGEAVEFPRENGEMHGVVTQPRPVSRELEAWVTTAGNPETWREAGENGAHILTHLLGQSIAEVKDKIAIYHAALRDAGHDPARFKVTLMLHAYLDETREAARDVARAPMKDYLRSAAGLIKQYAWAFPAFKKPEGVTNPFQIDLSALSQEETEAILNFAFERYFEESGFFGTVEDAVARAEELRGVGVSEIACLIEYGIDKDTVLAGLPRIKAAMERVNSDAGVRPDDFSLAAQIVRHEATHLQVTPSMARLFTMNDEARQALRGVRQILLGGEALPGALVSDLREVTDAEILNMYGPTETTIWSTVARPGEPAKGVEPIGRPIANTVARVLDDRGRPCPVGVSGELWIGGHGVARGYWQREALTRERFRSDTIDGSDGLLYRTGDLVRWRTGGQLDYLGRTDFQVKIRGQRIELGEIEAAMKASGGVTDAVVMARDVAGDIRLVGYCTGEAEAALVKATLEARLPAAMVPAHIMPMNAFPLTPNKKVDRNALPDPLSQRARAPSFKDAAAAVQSNDMTVQAAVQGISRIWQEVLGVTHIGPKDSFFDLGGHSLLAVQAHRMLREAMGTSKLSITDVFRFPRLAELAAHIASLGGEVRPPASRPAPEPERQQAIPVAEPSRRKLPDETAQLVARRRALRSAQQGRIV